MKSRARFDTTMRPSRKPARGLRNQRRNRRLFLESLESRQLLAVFTNGADSDSDIVANFAGNFIPDHEFKSAAPHFLTGATSGQPLDIAIDYLQQNASSFGLSANDLDHYAVTSSYTDAQTGITHIYLQQTYNGLPVADAVASIHVSQAGQVLTAGINFVPGLPTPPPFSTPAPYIPAHMALTILANATNHPVSTTALTSQAQGGQTQSVVFSGSGIAGLSADPIPASLHYVPKAGGGLELAWNMTVRLPDGTHWFEASVSADFQGRTTQVIRVADYRKDASYNVFPLGVANPLQGTRRVVINPQNAAASPFGWHDNNGFVGPEFLDTRGNNAWVQEDVNGDDQDGIRGSGAPNLNFNDILDLTLAPAASTPATTADVFHWVNLVHDISFHYGFTERAGNFQQENYSNLGRNDDPMVVDIQDSTSVNTSSALIPPDGQPGRVTIGNATAFTPQRDGSLDHHILVHELTHGISERLTGGAASATDLLNLQSAALSEGWSDWFALLLTTDFVNDNKNTPQLFAEWVTGVGFRRQPYSFDLAVDPLTLDDFNGGFPNNEQHNAGEIWASALWDLTWLLVERYGFDPNFHTGNGGNNVAMDLIFTGMKLQPANPSFLEARDAILAADAALFGGANFDQIWEAFSRRGMGVSASDGGTSLSDIVVEATDAPPPLARVSGTVLEDVNHNGQVDAGDLPLEDWVIFVDSNNNGVRDLGEAQTLSDSDGLYTLPLTKAGNNVIREVVMDDFQRILPASGSFTVNASPGSNFTGRNFLNRQTPGEISGLKFNDLNGNGARDTGEPGLAGVMIYVDLNLDGRIGVLEPAGVTDASGNYRITNVPVGEGLQVREVAKPGQVQTFPAPTTLGGAHLVTVVANTVTPDINFGNRIALDFGDAPASYGTLLVNNGPRHGIVAGYGLTLNPASAIGVVDGEANGQPHPGARGDDLAPAAGPNDENGVILPALTPGTTTTITVGARTAGFSNGLLQGWIDFNRDGDFLDAGEQVIKDRLLGQGIHNDISITIPASAVLGSTFARFRYGLERGIGPLGAALAGEVEDHPTNILQDAPIAVDDFFPDRTRVPPDPFIQLNSENNPLDVLRNDFGTTFDSTPEIVAADFPGGTQTTSRGGTVTFQGPSLPLLYTPPPGEIGEDTFTYRVQTAAQGGGTLMSGVAEVTITISPSDPIAVDDFISLDTDTASGSSLDILANDLAAQGQIKLIKAGSIIPLTSPNPTSLAINAARTAVTFTAPAGFEGTVRYQYTLEDTEPSTADSTAIVTIQVSQNGGTTPDESHAAIFRTQYLAADMFGNPTGSPTNVINLATSEFFFVQLIVNDPIGTPPGLPETTGVEAAYIDLLVDQMTQLGETPRVVPVIEPDGTFDITFSNQYPLVRRDLTDFSTPGVVNEIGATHDPTPPPPPPGDPPLPPQGIGNGEKLVMSVKFRALRNGTVRIQADHADSQNTPILLHDPTPPFPAPIQITDEQVFLQPAGTLTIMGGSGEGEFTNFRNFFDVNADEIVNTLDILTVVNDMTLNGSRPLNQFEIALSGVLPTAFLDTNLDAYVNTLDFLGIINYMTARGAVSFTRPAGGEGEGEGEGESAARMSTLSALPADDYSSAAAFVLTGDADEPKPDTTPTAGDEEILTLGASDPADEVVQATTSPAPAEAPLVQRIRSRLGEATVDTQAADELFAKLSSFRDQLRSRRRR